MQWSDCRKVIASPDAKQALVFCLMRISCKLMADISLAYIMRIYAYVRQGGNVCAVK